MSEQATNSALIMDRGLPLGNSLDTDGRRALHTKVKNTVDEPLYVSGSSAGYNPFAPPVNSKSFNRTVVGVVETFDYFADVGQLTLIKTIQFTYASTTLNDLVRADILVG